MIMRERQVIERSLSSYNDLNSKFNDLGNDKDAIETESIPIDD